jgi:hypothetical protein
MVDGSDGERAGLAHVGGDDIGVVFTLPRAPAAEQR